MVKLAYWCVFALTLVVIAGCGACDRKLKCADGTVYQYSSGVWISTNTKCIEGEAPK